MSTSASLRILVLGGGPAGRAALARLPEAILITRPQANAWHAEPGRLWVEGEGRVRSEPFDRLLVCADAPLLLANLGCLVSNGRVVTDDRGRTSVPGVSAAGRVTGADSEAAAAAQGTAAADALIAGSGGAIAPEAADSAALTDRLDPFDLAALLERPAGPARDAAVLAQCALIGPVRPAGPVSLAALAELAATAPESLPPQRDTGRLA